MNQETIKGHLDALILASLLEGPLHGYAITDSLRVRSKNLFDLPEGTVYPALYRLENGGYLKSTRKTINGRQRRVYKLTAQGRKELQARKENWKQFSKTVTAMLGT